MRMQWKQYCKKVLILMQSINWLFEICCLYDLNCCYFWKFFWFEKSFQFFLFERYSKFRGFEFSEIRLFSSGTISFFGATVVRFSDSPVLTKIRKSEICWYGTLRCVPQQLTNIKTVRTCWGLLLFLSRSFFVASGWTTFLLVKVEIKVFVEFEVRNQIWSEDRRDFKRESR